MKDKNIFGRIKAKTNKLDLETVKSGEDLTYGLGVRHVQAFLLFLCLSITYALRVNLSVAIVAMTDKNSTNPDFEEFNWNESQKSLLLSSFFWGYVITQVPGGQLAQRFGGKIMLLVSIFVCALLNLLTPMVANFGSWQALIVLRVVEGLCQGVIFPSAHTLLSKWAPPSERGRMGTYTYAGAQFGTVGMLAVSGVLASSSMGWPSIFYFSGGAGLIWSILWMFLGASSPADCKSISMEERSFIEKSLKTNEDDVVEDHSKLKTPWKSMFTSAPMIALIIAHSAHNFGFWTLLTEMPSYMKNVLDFDIKKNALLSALPYLVMWIFSMILSPIADFLTNRRILTREFSRKLFNSIGLWGPMCALIALAFVHKGDKTLAVALLTIAVGINSATYCGFQINHLDLAPKYAGTMMGITNCAANMMSILAPLVVGAVVDDAHDPLSWKIVFFISAGVYFFGNLQFIIFAKADIQPWNETPQQSTNRSNEPEDSP